MQSHRGTHYLEPVHGLWTPDDPGYLPLGLELELESQLRAYWSGVQIQGGGWNGPPSLALLQSHWVVRGVLTYGYHFHGNMNQVTSHRWS